MKPADHLSYFSEHPQIKKNKDIVVKPTASDLFAHVEQWAIAKGLDNQNNRNAQALKVMEEVGETMAALARGNKGGIKDGIGYLIGYFIRMSFGNGFGSK